jgi:sugar phosphate permease
MCTAIFLWAVSMLFGGVAATFFAILVSRALLGLGEGMHHPMQSSYIKKWFPPKERGKANAAWGVGMSIAPAMSMPIFTWIIAAYGWRLSFYACAVVSLIPLYLIWFHTTDTPRQHKRVNAAELQYIEEALAQEAKKEQAPSGETLWASAKLVIKNYRVWLLTIYWACYLICFWGILMWLPSYLKSARGFSWAQMGML